MKWIICGSFAIIMISILDVACSGQTGVSIFGNARKTSKIGRNMKSCMISSAQNTVYQIKNSDKEHMTLSQNATVDGNGTVVHIECQGIERENTSWHGQHYMVCYDGQWYPPGNVCLKMCPPVILLNSVIECTFKGKPVSCAENVRPRTLAEKRCKSGYRDSATDSVTNMCLETGEWNLQFVDCFISCKTDEQFQSNDTELNEMVSAPWTAGVYRKVNGTENFKFVCSATVVGTDIIITAAPCVQKNGKAIDNGLVRIAVGKSYTKWNDERDIYSQTFEVSIISDQSFHIEKAGRFPYVLKLLEKLSYVTLQRRIEVNSFVRSLCVDIYGYNNKTRYLHGKVTGWDETGKRVSHEATFYHKDDCKTMISELKVHDKKLDEEIARFGTFCTNRTFPDNFIGAGAVFYDRQSREYNGMGVLIGMYKSFSIFIGPRSSDTMKAMLSFYNDLIDQNF